MTLTGWRIYYGDGSVVDSTESSWEAAPADGVIAVAVRRRTDKGERSAYVLEGRDHYFASPSGQLIGANDDPDPLVRFPEVIVKRGQWVETPVWWQIRKDARAYAGEWRGTPFS